MVVPPPSARKLYLLAGALLAVGGGCFSAQHVSSPAMLLNSVGPSGKFVSPPAGIQRPLLPPTLPPAPPGPEALPPAPIRSPDAGPPPAQPPAESLLPPPRIASTQTSLELAEVLHSVDERFPLLLAIEQERAIASGQRLAAEGAFDLNVRTRGIHQSGTFDGNRFDANLEQASPLFGASLFTGYRFGYGAFPVYYGDRGTAQGGEIRAGILLPLLRDSPIDRRRANLRQAQISESLADPVVQRARIDYLRFAARAYWTWVSAGELYRVADSLLRIARDRQAGLEEQNRKGQIAEFVVIDNRRLIVEREGALIAAERRWQQTSFDLSLFLRDADGNPVVPPPSRLPQSFAGWEPAPPNTAQLRNDIETAHRLRPELARFQLLKERAAVELQWAENQRYPALNAAVATSQDLGRGKVGAGIFALDRSVLEASLLVEMPLQRREARGRSQAAQATIVQLLAQERFARDQIAAEVQDAVSNLDRTFQRLNRAREEQLIAQRVADLELERFRKGQGTLLEVNLRELAAAGAQAKVIEALADYLRAYADFRAALGVDTRSTSRR